MTGQKRKKIMDECPEEFEDELKSFIDEVESEVGSIVDLLDISSIDELHQIEEAQKIATNLADDIY